MEYAVTVTSNAKHGDSNVNTLINLFKSIIQFVLAAVSKFNELCFGGDGQGIGLF